MKIANKKNGNVQMCLRGITALTLCILYLPLGAFAQGANVMVGGQSKQTARKSYNKGRVAAKRDLSKGITKIKSYGLMDGCEYGFGQILKSEYKVELDWVAGCVVSPRLANEVAGYNSVMIKAVEKKFGKGVLQAAEKRAIESDGGHGKVITEYVLNQPPTAPLIPLPFLPTDDLPPPPPPRKN
jgi:hypothetical protein